MNKPFHFKQFTVEQDRCAMKIGTDGILLGSWTRIDDTVESILDIGAGTGIIALMMAQRSNAGLIDALEIDDDAYEQAVENFEESPWGDRLFCYHASLAEFAEEMEEEQYDLILSNPPFYTDSYKSNNDARNLARFSDSMPFEDLLKYAAGLLAEQGKFATIIPFAEETNFVEIAAKLKLFPNRITRVRGTSDSSIKRSLLEFSFSKSEIKEDELILEKSRHEYTEEYKDLVKDFYLKM